MTKEKKGIVIANVKIFDGSNKELSALSYVHIEGNKITKIAQSPINLAEGMTLVDGKGGTLMPGLIDAHAHLFMGITPMNKLLSAEPSYLHLISSRAAEDMLLRGFTSERDVGGPVFGLKHAIDEGIVQGPRVFPSGAGLTQTAGHFDFRTISDLPWQPNDQHFSERMGLAAIADGTADVLRRTREQLMRGASQIKMMAGGGVSSPYDPLDVTQYTQAEIEAAVKAAENWGTYVTVHAYTPKAIQLSIRSGVKCIEHGNLLDDETARMIADEGVWLCLQPFLDDEDSIPFPEGSDSRRKQLQMVEGTDTAYELAIKYGIKTAFGTDTLFDEKLASRQGAQLAKLTRWYSPFEVLKMATADNAELLAMSGLRTPYPGKLGVVEEGALADLLIVNGNPIEDINLIADPEKNFVFIMKDGKAYKNIL